MFIQDDNMVQEFLNDARSYHKTGTEGWRKRREIFTADISYNILGMAIEKYFMAFLIENNDIADNHTFSDLIDSYERIKKFPDDLAERLKRLEGLQNLCPLADAFSANGLTEENIDELVKVTDLVCLELGFTGY